MVYILTFILGVIFGAIFVYMWEINEINKMRKRVEEDHATLLRIASVYGVSVLKEVVK